MPEQVAWVDYVMRLSDAQRCEMLLALLCMQIEEYNEAEVCYREPEDYLEECIYWSNSGESLIDNPKPEGYEGDW